MRYHRLISPRWMRPVPYDWRYDLLGVAVYVALIGLTLWAMP